MCVTIFNDYFDFESSYQMCDSLVFSILYKLSKLLTSNQRKFYYQLNILLKSRSKNISWPFHLNISWKPNRNKTCEIVILTASIQTKKKEKPRYGFKFSELKSWQKSTKFFVFLDFQGSHSRVLNQQISRNIGLLCYTPGGHRKRAHGNKVSFEKCWSSGQVRLLLVFDMHNFEHTPTHTHTQRKLF